MFVENRWQELHLRRQEILVAFLKSLDLLFNFILGDAIGFLDPAGQHIALAGDHVEMIIGELSRRAVINPLN